MNDNYRNGEALYANVREQRIVFFLVFMGACALTFGFFFSIDFLPEKPGSSATDAQTEPVSQIVGELPANEESSDIVQSVSSDDARLTPASTSTVRTSPVLPTTPGALPVSIIFDSLDREVRVLNPESSSISALDTALLSGVIRHPDSGDFVNKGTIFLLGHSSYLPNVINKNFQAFNGIQKLAWGDTIRLRSVTTEYTYRVDRVYQTKATGAEIVIETGKERLTLATCNSFGAKDDRYVVEATLVSSRAL